MLIGLLLTVCVGCSPLRVFDALVPDSYAVRHSAIPYGDQPRQMLDVYLPAPELSKKHTAGDSSPTIVFLYGGAWEFGDREHYKFMASTLTDAGFIVVIPDYRLYPEVVFPAFVDDVADAFCWVLANIDQYGGDAENVAIMGHSAGAHIASMVHYDERYLGRSCSGQGRPKAFVGLAGPYDFLPLVSPTLQAIFPEAIRAESQPVNFVDGDEGPALLLHGLMDVRAKPRNSAALAEQVRAMNGLVQMEIYEDVEHVDLLLAFAKPLQWLAPVAVDAKLFLKTNFEVPQAAP